MPAQLGNVLRENHARDRLGSVPMFHSEGGLMLLGRRGKYFGAMCLAAVVLLGLVVVERPEALPWGRIVTAPAAMDGMVTISTKPDKSLIFITYSPEHPSLWRRLLHSTVTGAFAIEHFGSNHTSVAHHGLAHIDYERGVLGISFADSSRFVFTSAPRSAIPTEKGEVDSSVGIVTYHVAGASSHAGFIAQHDWTKRTSCGL